MVEHEMYGFIKELGLGTGLATGLFVAFFFLLKWVLKVASDQLAQMGEERKAWSIIQENFIIQMKALQNQICQNLEANRSFHEEVKEAHKYQREEHTEIMNQMREVTTSLGRINGYKK